MTGGVGTPAPRIAERSTTTLSPWVELVRREVTGMPGHSEAATYHSLRQADYVSVLAFDENGRVPLVRQYRPALECYTLELPGGLVDGDELPVEAAARELAEEVGLRADGGLVPLGRLDPDTGRLENSLWCFAAPVTSRVEAWAVEEGVEVVTQSAEQLIAAIADGSFRHALHISVVALAVVRRVMPAACTGGGPS